jgi:hypothetical protein
VNLITLIITTMATALFIMVVARNIIGVMRRAISAIGGIRKEPDDE